MAICDPELTRDLPPALTAGTGMDAFTHCVESYLSTTFHPICDGIAVEGLRSIFLGLETAVRDGSNAEARSAMMMGALLGGISFHKGLGVVHSLSHALGSEGRVHHGTLNAILLPHALRFNRGAATARMVELAGRLGLGRSGDAEGHLITLTELILARLPLPRRLGQLEGLRHDRISEYARLALPRSLPPDQSSPLYPGRPRGSPRSGMVTRAFTGSGTVLDLPDDRGDEFRQNEQEQEEPQQEQTAESPGPDQIPGDRDREEDPDEEPEVVAGDTMAPPSVDDDPGDQEERGSHIEDRLDQLGRPLAQHDIHAANRRQRRSQSQQRTIRRKSSHGRSPTSLIGTRTRGSGVSTVWTCIPPRTGPGPIKFDHGDLTLAFSVIVCNCPPGFHSHRSETVSRPASPLSIRRPGL